MASQSFNHQAAYTAVRIQIEFPNGHENRVSAGTGFFCLAKEDLGKRVVLRKLLLISNKHVLCDGNGVMTVRLNRKRSDGTPNYGKAIKFTYPEFSEGYFAHPDENVDLACVDVSQFTHSDVYIGSIDDKFLAPIDYEKVALGSDVLFVGFPDDRYDIVNNLPLVRKGTLASMPDIDFNGKGELVIDAQVFPGSSGSPVFVDWDGTYRLLGVISKTMLRRAANTVSPQAKDQLLGLGIVIKQRHIRELIDYTKSEIIRRWKNTVGQQSPPSPPPPT